MLKKIVSLTLIYTVFLLTSFSSHVFSQTQTNNPKAEQTDAAKTEPASPKPDVKKVFKKELSKSKLEKEEVSVDFNKIEKDQYKQTQKGKGLSKSQVTALVLFFAALAVVIVLVALYGKVPKCADVTCNPGTDEGCICDE